MELIQILLPMHNKVSLSFAELWEVGFDEVITAAKSSCTEDLEIAADEQMHFDIRVLRAQVYIDEILLQGDELAAALVQDMSRTVAFSRYIGVIRLTSVSIGSVDVIVDTTSTIKSLVFLLVVSLSNLQKGANLAALLASELQCRALTIA